MYKDIWSEWKFYYHDCINLYWISIVSLHCRFYQTFTLYIFNLMGRNKLMTFNAVVNALFLSLSYHFITSEEAWSGCNPIIPWRLFLINFEIVAHLYNFYGNKFCYKENIQNDKFTQNLKVIHVWISPLWYRFSFRKYFDVGL